MNDKEAFERASKLLRVAFEFEAHTLPDFHCGYKVWALLLRTEEQTRDLTEWRVRHRLN